MSFRTWRKHRPSRRGRPRRKQNDSAASHSLATPTYGGRILPRTIPHCISPAAIFPLDPFSAHLLGSLSLSLSLFLSFSLSFPLTLSTSEKLSSPSYRCCVLHGVRQVESGTGPFIRWKIYRPQPKNVSKRLLFFFFRRFGSKFVHRVWRVDQIMEWGGEGGRIARTRPAMGELCGSKNTRIFGDAATVVCCCGNRKPGVVAQQQQQQRTGDVWVFFSFFCCPTRSITPEGPRNGASAKAKIPSRFIDVPVMETAPFAVPLFFVCVFGGWGGGGSSSTLNDRGTTENRVV